MNGIPRAPMNRYNQVTDVTIAHNTWINCRSPWQFGVGSNISQKDVLPPSEIRSARPVRTLVANNILYNEQGDKYPILAHDEMDGISFKNNIINNQNVAFGSYDGLESYPVEMTKVGENIYLPAEGQVDSEVFAGFDFETISEDLFGNARSNHNSIGAISQSITSDPMILEKKKYGTNWYPTEETDTARKTQVVSDVASLSTKIAEAQDGDFVVLSPGSYELSSPLIIDKKITIQSEDENDRARIVRNESQRGSFP